MPRRPPRLDPTVDLGAGFDLIRSELGIAEAFPAGVLAEAEEAARRGPAPAAVRDRRDVPFLTVDPPGSTDLDQAVAVERRGRGFVVRYAIADVGAFVAPGGAIDAEARRRGVTLYLPDRRVPLHPPVLSEGAASLLPDGDRQALVWEVHLDASGEPTDVRVERALVRSRAKRSYADVQRALDGGTAEEPLRLLAEVGRLREAAEVARGGVSLPIPEQEVVEVEGRYLLRYRAALPVEGWSAQISLLVGACAARLMLDGGIGVLRTLPPPGADAVDELRRHGAALDVDWPTGAGHGDVIRSLDPDRPAHEAFLLQAVRLFRGAGYAAFDGAPPSGDDAGHAAVASPYAHVTAPLRRLVDRFGNEVVLALCAGEPVPGWAQEALPSLPALMAEAGRTEGAAERQATDLVEAATLAGCVGAVLDGVVVKVHERGAVVQLRDPAVVTEVARTEGDVAAPALGTEVQVRVVGADVVARRVTVELVG